MRRYSCFVVFGLLLILGSCNKPNIKVKLTSQFDTLSYYMGLVYAKNLQSYPGVEKVNPLAVAMAFDQVFSKDSIRITDMELRKRLQSIFGELQRITGEKNLKSGHEYLEKNKNNPGVITLPDGLQYKIIKDGNGPKPDPNDIVNVNYVGTTIDGKEFDSSKRAGGPVKISLGTGPGSGIKGFTEALLMMKVGSKWKIFIPSDLAYGPRANQRLSANSVLIFDVDLLGIEPKAPPASKKK